MCTLPSANVARTCRTMESPMITASRSVSWRGGEAVSGGDLEDRKRRRGRRCSPRSGSHLPLLLHPGSVVSRRRSEGHLRRSRPGCTGTVQRNTWSRGGGSVSSALYTYPGPVSVSPGCFQCSLLLSQLGLPLQQLFDLLLHGLQLQLHRMQLERVLTCTQR